MTRLLAVLALLAALSLAAILLSLWLLVKADQREHELPWVEPSA